MEAGNYQTDHHQAQAQAHVLDIKLKKGGTMTLEFLFYKKNLKLLKREIQKGLTTRELELPC